MRTVQITIVCTKGEREGERERELGHTGINRFQSRCKVRCVTVTHPSGDWALLIMLSRVRALALRYQLFFKTRTDNALARISVA